MRLSNLTWPKAEEYFRAHDTVLIGIGSIECHGRHMPLGTDTLIPDFLLDKIEQKSDVLIAPTIPYGACQSLAPYPGTIDIDNEVLYQFCRQIFLSLYRHGARKFVFLNGHGGNMKMIERLGLEFEDKGCLVAMLNWWLMAWDMNPAWKGGHGGGEVRIARHKIPAAEKALRRSGDGGFHHLLAARHAVFQLRLKRFFHMIDGDAEHHGAADDQRNEQGTHILVRERETHGMSSPKHNENAVGIAALQRARPVRGQDLAAPCGPQSVDAPLPRGRHVACSVLISIDKNDKKLRDEYRMDGKSCQKAAPE